MVQTAKTTGQLIRAARLAKGQSIYDDLRQQGVSPTTLIAPAILYRQTDLAEDAGVAQSAVSAYERGDTMPSLPTLIKLAAALEVPLTDLIVG